MFEEKLMQLSPQNKSERMPLQLTQRLEAVVVRGGGETDTGKGSSCFKGGELGELAVKAEGRVAFVASRGREVQLAQR